MLRPAPYRARVAEAAVRAPRGAKVRRQQHPGVRLVAHPQGPQGRSSESFVPGFLLNNHEFTTSPIPTLLLMLASLEL